MRMVLWLVGLALASGVSFAMAIAFKNNDWVASVLLAPLWGLALLLLITRRGAKG